MNLRKTSICAFALAAGLAGGSAQAQDRYLGEIFMVGYTFCPRGSFEANGALLPISQNTALFSLLGTTYGGNGQTTFALPNLQGRVPIGQGNGPGLSPRTQGQLGGAETVTLSIAQMPMHTHTTTINVSRSNATTRAAANAYFARAIDATYEENTAPTGDKMNPATVSVEAAGNNQPHENMQPYLAIRYCVVTQGIYPSRD